MLPIMKIHTGDKVVVISGKDRGKSGKVIRSLPQKEKVIVEGVNVVKRHERPKKSNQKGQIVDRAMPIHVSNVALVDQKSGKSTRVGYRVEEGKKVRIARKSNTIV